MTLEDDNGGGYASPGASPPDPDDDMTLEEYIEAYPEYEEYGRAIFATAAEPEEVDWKDISDSSDD
jgi:hypothetical protein